MVSLATVYEEQGKEEQALDLVEYVMKKNRETRKLNKERNITEENKAGETEVGSTSKKASIFDEAHHKTKKDEIKLREAQKLRAQQEKEVATKAMFEKLSEMDKIAGPNVLEMDPEE
ncbi:hypothetical protein G6F68_018414 [Rhizopus microsporus]|nr:hypothetical protein G6F68_018414 [Rhizopus microsporus]